MTIDEILAALDASRASAQALLDQLDTLRDKLTNIETPYDEARRLTVHWALRGFPDINTINIPLSTIQPSEVAGFMKPLTDRSKPVIEADVEAWLRFNNHKGKSDTIVMDENGPHAPECQCVGCRQDGYVVLVDFGMNSPLRYVCPHDLLHTDKSRATVFTYREAEDYIENTVTCDRSLYNIVLS